MYAVVIDCVQRCVFAIRLTYCYDNILNIVLHVIIINGLYCQLALVELIISCGFSCRTDQSFPLNTHSIWHLTRIVLRTNRFWSKIVEMIEHLKKKRKSRNFTDIFTTKSLSTCDLCMSTNTILLYCTNVKKTEKSAHTPLKAIKLM